MKNETTIQTHKKREPFAMVPKSVLNEQRLSWKAKGILAYLLGKPNNWKVRIRDVVNRGSDRYTAVKSGLSELRDFGYAHLECVREKGRIVEWNWHVSDHPQFKTVNKNNSPEGDFPPVEAPPVEKAPVVNRMLPILKGSKKEELKKTTTTNEAAEAASGDGVDIGKCFLLRWSQSYKEWFKTPYLSKPGEAKQAKKVIEELQCRPKDLMAYAFRMWINTTDYDEVDPEGFDPLWFQIKASRSVRFFLVHLSDIAAEQKEPLDCAIPVKEHQYQQLEAVVSAGRPT